MEASNKSEALQPFQVAHVYILISTIVLRMSAKYSSQSRL